MGWWRWLFCVVGRKKFDVFDVWVYVDLGYVCDCVMFCGFFYLLGNQLVVNCEVFEDDIFDVVCVVEVFDD